MVDGKLLHIGTKPYLINKYAKHYRVTLKAAKGTSKEQLKDLRHVIFDMFPQSHLVDEHVVSFYTVEVSANYILPSFIKMIYNILHYLKNITMPVLFEFYSSSHRTLWTTTWDQKGSRCPNFFNLWKPSKRGHASWNRTSSGADSWRTYSSSLSGKTLCQDDVHIFEKLIFSKFIPKVRGT